MFRVSFLLLALVAVCVAACTKNTIDSPRAFTREFADALRSADPTLKVEIVRDLEIKLTRADGSDSAAFLDNAYTSYKEEPPSKSEIIRRYVRLSVDQNTADKQPLDRARIVPVVKDSLWIKEAVDLSRERSPQKGLDLVYEDLCPGLVIVYAEDSPESLRYLHPGDLEQANLNRAELRDLACKNLRQLLPPVERRGGDGTYMFTAGGTFESSLLLFDKLWADFQKHVGGEIVIAVPARDLLLATGSENAEGLAKIRKLATEVHRESAYTLTNQLFVRRGGKWEEFK